MDYVRVDGDPLTLAVRNDDRRLFRTIKLIKERSAPSRRTDRGSLRGTARGPHGLGTAGVRYTRPWFAKSMRVRVRACVRTIVITCPRNWTWGFQFSFGAWRAARTAGIASLDGQPRPRVVTRSENEKPIDAITAD